MAYPGTFKSIQDSVIGKLRLSDSTANRALVKDWINQSYAQTCLESQALQQAGYGTLTANSSTYTLPTEIIELKWVIAKPASDNYFGVPLERVSIDEILSWRNGSNAIPPASGTVTAYALIGMNQLELWPTPSTADTIQFYYSYLPTALSADGDIPAIQEPWASKCLEYGALVQGAELRADPLLDRWDNKYQEWKLRFRTHMNNRGGMVDQFAVLSGYPVPRDNSVDLGC